MNISILLLVCISLEPLVYAEPGNSILVDPSDHDWEAFKLSHKKKYDNSTHEERRKKIWKINHKKIMKHNKNKTKLGYEMAVNKFADLSEEEFAQINKGFIMPVIEEEDSENNSNDTLLKRMRRFTDNNITGLPASLDWRARGLVTQVRDQKQCNSCWAFAAVGALEAQYFKKYGKLTALSEQNLIDCSKSGNFVDKLEIVEPKVSNTKSFLYTANGCNGGNSDAAFQFAKYNTIQSLANYPFMNAAGTCKSGPNYSYLTNGVAAGFTHIYPSGDEKVLLKALAKFGTIVAAMDSSKLQFYSSGIYSNPICDAIDHSVLIVGFGSDGIDKDFYIVKNSWGVGWGENGYFRLARNQGNMCGIASVAAFPLV